jgi:hypothetical protein
MLGDTQAARNKYLFGKGSSIFGAQGRIIYVREGQSFG